MASTARETAFLLANPERRFLIAIASRLPGAMTSNHLTVVGAAGALGAGLAYSFSGQHVAWLWVASSMLVVNWFGDSLDGTVARVRNAERPRYGYYLDHIVDAFSTSAIGIGIGLSPFVALIWQIIWPVLIVGLSLLVMRQFSRRFEHESLLIRFGLYGITDILLTALCYGAILQGAG